MRNLHLFVSTAKPEGSSGGENEEQKRELLSCGAPQRSVGKATRDRRHSQMLNCTYVLRKEYATTMIKNIVLPWSSRPIFKKRC